LDLYVVAGIPLIADNLLVLFPDTLRIKSSVRLSLLRVFIQLSFDTLTSACPRRPTCKGVACGGKENPQGKHCLLPGQMVANRDQKMSGEGQKRSLGFITTS
jgi:hypothetical protein